MIARILFILVLTGLAVGVCAAQDEPWQKFSPPDHSCSLLFPVTPDKQQKSSDASSGKIVSDIWLAKETGALYMLGITDYPVDINEKLELDLDRDNFLKAVHANLITESETILGSHRGREFVGASTDYTFRSRIFVIRRRVYQTVVAQPTANLNAKIADKFLASFALMDVSINK
jgi:hypothetical protein